MGQYSTLVVDVMNSYHIGYHSNPTVEVTVNGEKIRAGGIYGVIKTALFLARNLTKGGKVFFLADDPWQENADMDDRGLRRLIDPEYKANRLPRPPEVKAGYPLLVPILKNLFPGSLVSYPGYEADDFVLPLTQGASESNRVLLVSGDSDWLRGLSPHVDIFKKGGVYTLDDYVEDYGTADARASITLQKSFRGDDDNIPNACPRLPAKTLEQICHVFKSIDETIENASTCGFIQDKWADRIKESADRLRKNSRLVDFLPIDQATLRASFFRTSFRPEVLKELYASLGFPFTYMDGRVSLAEYD